MKERKPVCLELLYSPLQVFSIGDDEPERKAAAYVAMEMPDLVKGVKIMKMIYQPDISELSVQLDYIIANLRSLIHRNTPFDVALELYDSTGNSEGKL